MFVCGIVDNVDCRAVLRYNLVEWGWLLLWWWHESRVKKCLWEKKKEWLLVVVYHVLIFSLLRDVICSSFWMYVQTHEYLLVVEMVIVYHLERWELQQ